MIEGDNDYRETEVGGHPSLLENYEQSTKPG